MSVSDEEFYRKHADGLRRLAFVLVGAADGDDVFANAVLRVLRSRAWRRLDDDAKRGYLYRAVVNEAKRFGRQSGSRRLREQLYMSQRAVAVEQQTPEEIWSVVASLSVRQRAVVYLTYYEDLDTAAVADRLGISVGSVYQHLHRARSALERRIDG